MSRTAAPDSRKLYLIDGTAQLFRAYFALPPLTNAAGQPTGAVKGFTMMLRKLLVDHRPDYVAAAFDLPGEVFRHDTFPEYKANRDETPEELNAQLPWAKRACEVLGVEVLEQPRYEADDLIAGYAKLGVEQGFQVTIVASDKDLFQLVRDGVDLYNPNKEERYDAAGVEQAFGVRPESVVDVQGLQGDSVDNIPGVPGVGPKTAIGMIRTYGDLEAVLDRAARFVATLAARDAWVEGLAATAKSELLQAEDLDRLKAVTEQWRQTSAALIADEADEAYRARVHEARLAVEAGLADADLRAGLGKKPGPLLRPLAAARRALKSLDKGSARKSWMAAAEHADLARMSREIALLRDEVPSAMGLDELLYRGPDAESAASLFGELGFESLLREFSQAAARDEAARVEAEADGGGGQPGASSDRPGEPAAREATTRRDAGPATQASLFDEPAQPTAPAGDYVAVFDVETLGAWVQACRRAGRFCIDTETDSNDPMRARLVGISLAHTPGSGAYLPIGHDYLGVPDQLRMEDLQPLLGPLLADPTVGKIAQNQKFDDHVLRRHGLPVDGWSLDTMVAAFLIDASRSGYGMDVLAAEYLGRTTIAYKELVGTGAKRKTLNAIEIDRVRDYAAEDADVTLQLARLFEQRLDDLELKELYASIDGPLLPLLARMEAAGIRVDAEVLGAMSTRMARSMERTRKRIHELAGGEFNVDSPKQLREILFERLGLKPLRKTAKGKEASTDHETLEALSEEHPIAAALLEYREESKLRGTYVDALPKLIHPDTGRVHTSYHPTGAATGRLSSSDPNLQNIPARTEAGRQIRAAFVPEPGFLFLASDYSQVELRILAHMTEDSELIAAFQAGEDIHRYTAARVFGVDPAEVSSEMRTRAKAVNFGILYGMSEIRLAREQGMRREDARAFIAAYFERFSSVRSYIDRVRDEARSEARVRTLLGRLRSFPQLHGRAHRGIQEQALRAALNTTIQGTAADLMKLAMLRVDRAVQKGGWNARILLQVHDELLLEVSRPDIDAVIECVRTEMEQVWPLRVPLKVDQKVGESWLEVT